MSRDNRMGLGLMILGLWCVVFGHVHHDGWVEFMSIADEVIGAYMIAR